MSSARTCTLMIMREDQQAQTSSGPRFRPTPAQKEEHEKVPTPFVQWAIHFLIDGEYRRMLWRYEPGSDDMSLPLASHVELGTETSPA
jgi:hypothetical protein